MIQIALYVSAGFLAAALIALLALPFLTGRAANTAVRKLRAKLPFTTAEMTAEKDQLKAEFAIALRKIEIDLTKQSEKVATQNIEIRTLTEKLNGASKVSKASKLALEEIRAKEHDLNERLRQRDVQYAGLEQRSRQMLRENRELKLELKKEGRDVKAILAGRAEKTLDKKPTTSKSGLPIADIALAKEEGELSVQNLREALSEARRENQVVEREIKMLKASLAAGRGEAGDKKAQLPKAAIPAKLGGTEDTDTNDAMHAANDLDRYPDVKDQIMDLAASLTAITSLLEEDDPKVRKLLKDTKPDPDGALGARIKALLDADEETKPTAKPKRTTSAGRSGATSGRTTKLVEAPKPSVKMAQKKEPATINAKMPEVKSLELEKNVGSRPAAKRATSTTAAARKKTQPSQNAKPRSATKPATSRSTTSKKTEKA